MGQVLDIAGQPIEVGDTVVYGVQNKYGEPLQMGVVTKVVDYMEPCQVYNPAFDYNGPRDNTNPRFIDGERQIVKISVKAPDTTYKDKYGDDAIQPGKRKTLDTPSRFAVIKKG